MDVAEFEELIDRLGEDVRRWPSPDREAALVLLRNSAPARNVLGRAEELRRLLAAPPQIKAPAGLADRIVAKAGRLERRAPGYRATATAAPPPYLWSWIPPLRPAIALSLCFAFGLSIGLLPDGPPKAGVLVDFPTLLAHLID